MSAAPPEAYHVPVMLDEVLQYLDPQPGETMIDCTLGGGGHSEAIAMALRPGGTLIALDRDTDALNAAGAKLARLRNTIAIIPINTDFGNMTAALDAQPGTGELRFDGALFDLGVSSFQLDGPRGFSFRRDEPLDMRMHVSAENPTAADLLATETETEIARALFEYGEERFSRRIAREIVARRSRGEPVRTTGELAALVEHAIPRSAWPEIHVATRTFMGLRIAVNDELGQLRRGLRAAVDRLKPGGRIVVISFHSLEDRITKQMFAEWSGRGSSAPGSSPAAFAMTPEPVLNVLTRKPVVPSIDETNRNPRARSAKLRAARKLP